MKWKIETQNQKHFFIFSLSVHVTDSWYVSPKDIFLEVHNEWHWNIRKNINLYVTFMFPTRDSD